MRTRTRAWPSIVEFYDQLIRVHGWRVEPMLELAEFLGRPPYGNCLFAYTSHETLCVGRVADFTAGDGELQILYSAEHRFFRFVYIQRPDDRAPWSRECAAAEWQSVIQRVLHERLGWFGLPTASGCSAQDRGTCR